MSKYPHGKYERHPLNEPGPFYVEEGQCIKCLGPCNEAPDLIGFFQAPPDLRGFSHCYIKKQPTTPDEMHRIIHAITSSMCSGLRYCGDEPRILRALHEAGCGSRCDELSDNGAGEAAGRLLATA